MVYKIYLVIFLSISLFGSNLDDISKKIYQNECGSNPKNLIHFNSGESFVSLGIGHFIWYKKPNQERFVESFPKLIEFIKKHGKDVPKWLQSNSPWSNKTQMYSDSRLPKLKEFLIKTIPLQALFMKQRLNDALASLTHVQKSYNRVSKIENGDYILIDYLNFKGLGDNKKERYNSKGWGLIQVLECMPNISDPKSEFRECAKAVLKQRVDNSPKTRDEKRWLKGWFNRIETYR
jgi:hypothetical protein